MSIFCSILQNIEKLPIFLPHINDFYYVKYYQRLYENYGVALFQSPSIQFIYSFILQLHIKTQRFQVEPTEFFYLEIKLMKKMDDNLWISPEYKNIAWNIFTKAMRVKNAFSRLLYIYKFKKAPIRIQTDLLLNDIDLSKKNVFAFIQNDVKYVFVANDLINIIQTSLSNCPYYFAAPLHIKNPYNNLPLSHATLYNFYFFMRSRLYFMPTLFELFFHAQLNLNAFKINNENCIRDLYIKEYTLRTHYRALYSNVWNMLHEHNDIMRRIRIHRDFPKETLVNIMRPYLRLYLMSKYLILGSEKKAQSYNLLRIKLQQFVHYNPQFGRKILCRNVPVGPLDKIKYVPYFNADYVSFYMPDLISIDSESDDDHISQEEDIPEPQRIRHVYVEAPVNVDRDSETDSDDEVDDWELPEPDEDP